MKTVIINKHIRYERLNGGVVAVQPFILAYRYTLIPNTKFFNWKDEPFWLEYSKNTTPSDVEILTQRQTPSPQAIHYYKHCRVIQIQLADGPAITYATVCERIPNGIVGVFLLENGCLWTMVPALDPKDNNIL